MIKIIAIQLVGDNLLELEFSDGSHGVWSAADILARDTVLTRPLTDHRFFERAFIEAGALAWPNGLELSPQSLHTRLRDAGALVLAAA